MSALHHDPLTVAQAARIMREAVRDKTYQIFPMGQEAAAYLRVKRKRLRSGPRFSCIWRFMETAGIEPACQSRRERGMRRREAG